MSYRPHLALLLLAMWALPAAAVEVVGFGHATTGGEGFRDAHAELDLKMIGDATNLTSPRLQLQAPTTSLPTLTGPCL